MSGTETGIQTETVAAVPEWKPERRILTESEGDNEGFYTYSSSLELRIDRFAEFVSDGEWRQSEPMYIRGLPFEMRAFISKEASMTTNHNGQSPSKTLFVVLSFNQGSTWKCQAITTLRVVAQKEGVNDIIREDTKAFLSGTKDHFVPFSHMLLDPENGFIKDDTIILQAHVQASSVKIMTGI
ncbi:MATH domain protein [Ditylenchus destructor]|uniref:MATH domain protein n=1 Tax=Ditylenchus destructor TaxID=166010 RepID=A0AAD4MF78_9BILA|nr:MATH domain protein [Ditylenchus destructor]